MIVKKYSGDEHGDSIDYTSLKEVITEQVTSSRNQPEMAAEMLSNLVDLLVRKKVISIAEVSNDVCGFNPEMGMGHRIADSRLDVELENAEFMVNKYSKDSRFCKESDRKHYLSLWREEERRLKSLISMSAFKRGDVVTLFKDSMASVLEKKSLGFSVEEKPKSGDVFVITVVINCPSDHWGEWSGAQSYRAQNEHFTIEAPLKAFQQKE